ncbi:MAG: hypothetical protein J6Y20_05315 [Lachnospiraceae bacterium]|nr:hypothetical protein [Lachnospiraceae bacterium]MBP5461527.1 hypothetical protein [Lachnospiraceae bacterium]
MPSILSSNNNTQPNAAQDPSGSIKNIINQILSSVNPQQTFNQILASNQQAQNAMNLVNQYGNGDPKAAFLNYMNSTGKQSLGQQIMQKLGLEQ